MKLVKLLTMEVMGQWHLNLLNSYWEAAQIDSEDSNKDLIHLLALSPQYYK